MEQLASALAGSPSTHAGLTRGPRWVSCRSFAPSAFGGNRWRLPAPILCLAVWVPSAAHTAPITPAWAPEKCVSGVGPVPSRRPATRFGGWRHCSCTYDGKMIRISFLGALNYKAGGDLSCAHVILQYGGLLGRRYGVTAEGQ